MVALLNYVLMLSRYVSDMHNLFGKVTRYTKADGGEVPTAPLGQGEQAPKPQAEASQNEDGLTAVAECPYFYRYPELLPWDKQDVPAFGQLITVVLPKIKVGSAASGELDHEVKR